MATTNVVRRMCSGVWHWKNCHFHKPDTEVRSATISFDYMFLKKTGEYGQSEVDTADGGMQILVVKDSKSRVVFAHVVPQKGVDPKRYVVDMIVEDVLWLGWSLYF